MLSDQEFVQHCERCGYSKKAQAEMEYIRSEDPSRRVRSARGNVSGSYPSLTMGVSNQFESHKVELPFLHQIDHDKEVLEFFEQPPPIKLSYILQRGKRVGKRTAFVYTPDFFLIKKDAAGWVECKTEEELRRRAEENPERFVRAEDGQWRCPPGEEYASQFGFFFQVVSSAALNPIFSRNIEYLRDYLRDELSEVGQDAAEQVLRLIAEEPGITLEELRQRADKASSDDINMLIAKERVYFNLHTAPLADPRQARLYPDEDIARAYSVTCGTVFSAPNRNTGVVRVLPETTILWDNKPWTIVNAGETRVTLISEDERQSIVELLYDKFYSLLSHGALVGLKDEVLQATIDVTKARELFAGARREDFRIANQRYDTILPILRKQGFPAGCSAAMRTIWSWVGKYREAIRLYGNGYVGLIPRIKARGNRKPRIRQDTLEFIDEFIKNEYQKLKQENKATVYGKFLEKCGASHVPCVSYKTFIREISRRSGYDQTKKRKGRKGAYNEKLWFWELERLTPRHGDRPWEIGHIDHTQLEIELIHSKTKKNLGRPWLTILIDAYSRRILAIFLTFDKPSYRSCMMVLRECVRRHHRLPQTIVYDGATEFRSTYFETLLARYECTRKVRPWSEPRYGTTCERIFGTVHTKFVHNLLGNTQIMKNVRQVTKDVNPKELAVWDLENFYKLLSEFCYEFYDSQEEHPALGQTPREAYGAGLAIHGTRASTFIAYNEDFVMYTLPTTRSGKAMVRSTSGVQMHNIRYWAKAFDDPEVNGTVVPVRYDPFDASTAYAYVKGKWVRCVSDYAADFKGRSEKEIEIASHELRQRNRRHGQQFNITQKQLASWLRKADATEALLMQRLCDSEVKSVLATINGERADEEGNGPSLSPAQSSAAKRPVSVLDADVEVQKRPRKLKTYEDY